MSRTASVIWEPARWLLPLLVFMVIVFAGMALISRFADADACNDAQEATQIDTKFVNYNWVRHDCLVRLDTGKWVPLDSLNIVATRRAEGSG